MNPAKVDRARVRRLTDLPNVGPATARDLELIGIERPDQLLGKNPLQLYQSLCRKTGTRHDPCVLDVFMSITRFVDGEEPQPWWNYSAQRKRLFGADTAHDVSPLR